MASYIFAFNPTLSQLTIIDGGRRVSLTRGPQTPIGDRTDKVEIRRHGSGQRQWVLIHHDRDEVAAAVQVDVDDGSQSVHLPDGLPRLFLAFPLNNTTNLCIPVVVNSENFRPQPERDGIYLGTALDEANKKNMDLFLRACHLIVDLITLAVNNEWGNAPRLAVIPPLECPTWADKTWLQNTIKSALIQGLRGAPLLHTHNGATISPRNAWVPVDQAGVSARELWDVAISMIVAREHFPRSQDLHAWSLAVNSWGNFFAPTEPALAEAWTVDKLAERLVSLRTMEVIGGSLVSGSDPLAWINRVHGMFYASGREELIARKSLVPNQRGELCLVTKLYRDGGIDDELKSIADLLGQSVRSELLHLGITTSQIIDSLKVRSQEYVINSALDAIRRQTPPLGDTFLSATVALFAWLLRHGQAQKLDGFPLLSMADPSGKRLVLTLRSNSRPEDRFLAPSMIWPDLAQPFVELFPESILIDERYALACPARDAWEALVEFGFIHVAPLYEVSAIVEHFLPDDPLSEDEQRAKPKSIGAVRRTDVAWLSKADRSVIDRARSSQSRGVKFLKFCVDYLIPSDPSAFDIATVKCDNDADHRYYSAAWLAPVKTRSWVMLEKGKRLVPSAEVLARMLSEAPDLLQRVTEPRMLPFLEALGVGAADLTLRSVGKDNPERLLLIQSLASIMVSAGNKASTVIQLAGTISEDKGAFKALEDRRVYRQRAMKNQQFGFTVEGLFKQAFIGTGLTAERTGAGDDFEMIAENGDAGEIEVSSASGPVFVEVKATTGSTVRMSVRQVEKAVNKKVRYVLCVVPASEQELAPDTCKQVMRFVVDIGDRLRSLWSEYKDVIEYTNLCKKDDAGLKLEMFGQTARFCVSEEVWSDGVDFATAVDIFRAPGQ